MTFVTGATGLVGSHLLLGLCRRGEKVIALKRKNSNLKYLKNVFSMHPHLYETIVFIDGDVLSIDSLDRAFEGVRKVYHCAGIVSFDPADVAVMMRTNIEGTGNIVNLCIKNNIEKLCYVSSVSAINRIEESEIITETTGWRISNENTNYALSKYQAENLVWKGIEQGLKAVIINPTIIIGYGNWTSGSSAMFHQVWRGIKFYPTGTAGFVDVRDVTEIAIDLMEKNVFAKRFIINGENLSFRQVLNLIAENFQKEKPSLAASSLMLNMAWRLAALKNSLFKVKPFITKETTLSGMKKLRFSNERIREVLGTKFIPIEKSINYTCKAFLKYEEEAKNPKACKT